jgi:hypothetical protein
VLISKLKVFFTDEPVGRFPRASVCASILNIPKYTSIDEMADKFRMAFAEKVRQEDAP